MLRTRITHEFQMKCGFVSLLTVFDALKIVESSPDEVEPSLDEVKSQHWSKMVREAVYC